jgi:hypothetical protein
VFFRYIKISTPFVAAASIFALAACSSGTGSVGVPPLAMQPSSLTSQPLGKPSKDLLYVSDSGTNGVETLAWPKPQSGTPLPGSFSEPQGMCSDQSGDVFIANTGDSNILEYSGTTLVKTISDPNQYPVDCSFSSLNGDLAAANIITTQDGAGGVSIFKKAGGTPKIITGSVLQRAYFLAYDGSGNLFVTGENTSYQAVFAELKAGSDKIKQICPKLFGPSAFPGAIAWDGKSIVIADGSGLERIKNCKPVGPPILTGGDIGYFAIVGNRLVASNAGSASVQIYSYPQGKLLQTLTGFSQPDGVAVSQTLKGK